MAGGSRLSNIRRNKGYLIESDDVVTVIVKIETRETIEELEAIAQVPVVDGVLIELADFSATMGSLSDIELTVVENAIRDAAEGLFAISAASATPALIP